MIRTSKSGDRRAANRMKRLAPVVSAISAGLFAAQWAQGVNYTWTVLNSGNATGSWSVPTNWNPNLPGPTAGADVAFFNAQNITLDSTVSLDAPQTIGGINFGDTDPTSAAGWTLNATSTVASDATNILTLLAGGGYETINVGTLGTGKVATINARLSNGDSGGLSLAKGGAGTLVLTAANSTLTGAVAINNGVLMLDFSQAWSPVSNIIGDTTSGAVNASRLEGQGGTLRIRGAAGAANSQTFSGGTGLELGATSIIIDQNGANSVSLGLGELQRNVGGVMDVTLPSAGNVTWAPAAAGGDYPLLAVGSAVSTGGLIVDTNGAAFVTVNGGADWAADNAGNIVPASTVGGFYTASTANSLADNADLVTNTTLAGAATISSLRMNDAAARTLDLGGAGLTTGGLLVTPTAGSLTISNGNISGNTLAANGDFIIHHSGPNHLTISGNIVDSSSGTTGLTKTGSGTLVLTGANTYTGTTIVNGGALVINAGTTGIMTPAGLPDVNTEIAPAFGDRAEVVVTGGTLDTDRLIVAGNGGNFAGGDGVLTQTGGTINSSLWFAVGSVGNGTFNMSGGTLNQNHTGVTQMEVAVFGAGRSAINLSGTAQINLFNNANLAMGVVNNTGAGTINHNGGAITFFSDAGTTVGGTGNLVIGGGGTGEYAYRLNGGTLTAGGVSGSARGTLYLNGGVLKAARDNAAFIGGGMAVRVQAGGANIDTNGRTVNTIAGFTHDPALGATPDGGLIKNGAGTLRLSGMSTYTGPTVINAGTLLLTNAAGIPQPVGAYSFDDVRDTGNGTVTSGALGQNFVVRNTGAGGATLHATVNHVDNIIDPFNGTASLAPGMFGNALSLDGAGSSVDIASQIVDQSSGGVWTMSTWVKTNTPGSTYVSKNTGGTTWTAGLSAFYLATNPISGTGGTLPTAVRNAGGFIQSDTGVVDDQWHMITFVGNGSVKQIYVDGVLQNLLIADFNNADASTFVRLGYNTNTLANLDGNVHFAGLLDEMKFFNVALTPQQIQELFAANAITTATVGAQYLPATTPLSITAAGAALDLAGANQVIGSLQGVAGSKVFLGSGVLTTGGNNTSTTFAGDVSGTGGIVKNGSGSFTMTGANTYTGTTTVQGGRLILSTTADDPVFTGGGADIKAGRLVLDASTAAQVATILDAGYDQATRFSTGALRTSNPADSTRGLGWINDGTNVVVAYTFYGDADLDFDVDGIDVGLWAQNFTGELGGAGTSVWAQGDWDYDGDVDGIDVGLWAQNFTGELGGGGLSDIVVTWPGNPQAAAILQGLGVTLVPEPGMLGLAGLGFAGLARRRRR